MISVERAGTCGVAGGMFVVGLVAVGASFAHAYDIQLASADDSLSPAGSGEMFVPVGAEDVTGFYGIRTAAPGIGGSIQGTQDFNVFDADGQQIGSFRALVGNAFAPGVISAPNNEILVTQVLSGTPGTAPGDVPAIGSVFDNYNSSPAFTNGYADFATTPLPTPGQPGDTIFDTATTLFGPSSLPLTYDASSHEDPATNIVGPDGLTGPGGTSMPLPLSDGDSIVVDTGAGESQETLTGVNGIPPLYVAAQGQGQTFDVVNPAGATVGTFTADVTTTGDGANGYSEALLVTADGAGSTVGTAEGDAPAVGSVFNILFFFNPNLYSMYSDLAPTTPGGTSTITDTVYHFGQTSTTPSTFDGVTGLTDGTNLFSSIPFDNGLTITPRGAETYTGVNGLPPGNESVQGYQTFDITNSDGQTAASFIADETTYSDALGGKAVALLVTGDGNGGSDPSDAPPVGSWIEYSNYGSGFGTLYTDLTATQDTATETLITPFGDLNMPTTIDASMHLASTGFDLLQAP